MFSRDMADLQVDLTTLQLSGAGGGYGYRPLVHGLAILIAAATAMTISFQGVVMKEREALEAIVHAQKEELEYRAYHDSLTRLPNRTAFLERLVAKIDGMESRRSRSYRAAGVGR